MSLINSINSTEKGVHSGDERDVSISPKSASYLPAECLPTSCTALIESCIEMEERASGAISPSSNVHVGICSSDCCSYCYSKYGAMYYHKLCSTATSASSPTSSSAHVAGGGTSVKSFTNKYQFTPPSQSRQSTISRPIIQPDTYQKAILIGNVDEPQSLNQKIKMIAVIAVSTFLGLFASFLTVYLVVERLWFTESHNVTSYTLVENKGDENSLSPNTKQYTFFGDYQPIGKTPLFQDFVQQLVPPQLNQSSMAVFYDFSNALTIIKTVINNETMCYLNDLDIPPDLLLSGNIEKVLSELSSQPYIEKILNIDKNYLYNPRDVLVPELHGAKVTEVCSKAKLYRLISAES